MPEQPKIDDIVYADRPDSIVAGGIVTLAGADLIRIGDDDSERFSGLVHVLDVDRLKDYALREVREKQVRPLLP